MITVTNLTLPYVDNTIRSYEFHQGEIYHIDGKNGMGKTIFLDCLAGLYRRKDIKRAVTGNNNLIYINQQISFHNKLTSKDLLYYVYQIYNKNIDTFYDFLRLFKLDTDVGNLLKKQFGSLSGGEIQFFMCLILLSVETDWYLLDEPFHSLDKEKKAILSNILDYLRREKNKGIILTSHEAIVIEHTTVSLEKIIDRESFNSRKLA